MRSSLFANARSSRAERKSSAGRGSWQRPSVSKSSATGKDSKRPQTLRRQSSPARSSRWCRAVWRSFNRPCRASGRGRRALEMGCGQSCRSGCCRRASWSMRRSPSPVVILPSTGLLRMPFTGPHRSENYRLCRLMYLMRISGLFH